MEFGGSTRILHVASNPNAAAAALARTPHAVETAPDAAAGFARFRAADIDCVVVPRDLPEADGLSLLLAIRAEDERTPVVVYTERGDQAFALRIAGLGGVYHRRTGDPDRLSATICQAIAGHRRAAASATTADAGPTRGET